MATEVKYTCDICAAVHTQTPDKEAQEQWHRIDIKGGPMNYYGSGPKYIPSNSYRARHLEMCDPCGRKLGIVFDRDSPGLTPSEDFTEALDTWIRDLISEECDR